MDKKAYFIKKLRQIYPDKSDNLLAVLEKPRYRTLRRVNLSGVPVATGKYPPGPFPGTYYIENGLPVPKSDMAIKAGIYIQGFSSMIPALLLDAQPGEKVLDLCAAPGSKSSQVADLTGDKAEITCIDNNLARIYALEHNLRSQQITNFKTVRTDASVIQYNPAFWEKYDKVLADVPCSNEGNIRFTSPELLEKWNPKLSKKIPTLQKKIAASGVKSLKKGGRMIYSTCTYSVEENEAVVDWILKKFPEMTLEPISLPLSNVAPGFDVCGKKKFNSEVKKCLRVLPNELFDGFFVASLLKL